MKKLVWVLLSLILIFIQLTGFADYTTDGDFEYEDNGESITITNYYGNATNLIIPDTINGKPVTGIRDYIFRGEVSLENVTIPASITYIDYRAFNYNKDLLSINVSPKNLYYSSDDGVLFDKNKTTLIQYTTGSKRTTYTITDTVTDIAQYAFDESIYLTEIILPPNLKKIGTYAFGGCTKLKTIDIPNTVNSIGVNAFSWCYELSAVNVDQENLLYSSQNGILFDKSKTVLIQYPINNGILNYIMPSSVEIIGDMAFSYCGLKHIVISENLKTIQNYSFYACQQLLSIQLPSDNPTFDENNDTTGITRTIKIPNRVESIGYSAFRYCNSLTTVTIGNNVKTLISYAFCNCNNLISTNLPKSLTYMGSNIFSGCPLLTIYGYNNTLAQNYAMQNNIQFIGEENTPIYIENMKLNSENNSISGTIFNFSQNEIASAKVGCATYGSNGKLIELKFANLENLADKSHNTFSFQLQNITTIANYKIFLWNSLLEQQPLCPAKVEL